MLNLQTLVEQITGDSMVLAMTEMMKRNFEDFAREQEQYEQAMILLQKELGEHCIPSVKDVKAAILRKTASDLLFSGYLGIKANLDNFIDPVSRNFLDVSFETYLREVTAHKLSEYVQAQDILHRFYALLSPSQKEVYDAIRSYISSLETIVPKLAHYYGYLLGNVLLCKIIPGYHTDMALTINYCVMLENYFGKAFLPTAL